MINNALQSGYYSDKNVDGYSIKYITTTGVSQIIDGKGYSYGFLTYGQPHGDQRDGQYRYIGYTKKGEDYTNLDFPADQNANNADFASQSWIYQPWDNSAVKASSPNFIQFQEDGSSKYHTPILAGIVAYGGENTYNGYTLGKDNPDFWNNIEQYVHILAPPTDYAWGIGRMWHYKNGSLFYVTVPIMATSLLSDLDLEVTSLETGIPQGTKAQPGQSYTGTVTYKNISTSTMSKDAAVVVTIDGVETTLKDQNGNTIDSLTLAPDESKTLTFTWQMPTNSTTLKATINLPPDVDIPEVNLTNNEKTITVTADQQNLKVQVTSCPGEAQPGQTVNVSGKVTNESDTPVTTIVQWYVGSNKVYEGNVTIDKTKDLNFPFTMPSGDTSVTVQVNPAHDQPPNETDWTDNKDSATIKIPVVNVPTNSQLIITARSRGGDDQFGNYQPRVTRPKGTAKWGDDITVTFHAPDEPEYKRCYDLDTWELVSAKVIYPKRHPDFTFGHPLDPVGTIKKSMTVSGNSATVTFNEDWSNYGADVYDVIAGQHIPGPTLYDIKVEYIMYWKYEKGSPSPNGCQMKLYEKNKTYTVKGKILVNGTSVIPLAG